MNTVPEKNQPLPAPTAPQPMQPPLRNPSMPNEKGFPKPGIKQK